MRRWRRPGKPPWSAARQRSCARTHNCSIGRAAVDTVSGSGARGARPRRVMGAVHAMFDIVPMVMEGAAVALA